MVDLAWLRTTPWRERVAATFDPPRWRDELGHIDSVTVRHRPDSGAAGVLFFGWLASRLGWGTGSLMAATNGSVRGHATARRQDVTLTLEPDPGQDAPGLAGVEIGTSSGMSISLDRGPGGLLARRRDTKGREREWTILGASRGEGGILGEGIRQALLRDPAYRSALDCRGGTCCIERRYPRGGRPGRRCRRHPGRRQPVTLRSRAAPRRAWPMSAWPACDPTGRGWTSGSPTSAACRPTTSTRTSGWRTRRCSPRSRGRPSTGCAASSDRRRALPPTRTSSASSAPTRST